MGFRKVLMAASALVLATGVANAGYERDGWYVGVEGAWVSVPDTELIGSGITELEFDSGWGALGTVGYALSNSNWRIEGEVGYRMNDAVAATTLIGFGPYTNGELTEWSYMINAVYDFKFSSERFGFSVGAGVGLDDARLQFDESKDRNYNLAAQGIAGITYRVSQHWDLALNYRYLWVDEVDLVLPIPLAPVEVETEMELSKHTISIGLRYGYNDPPAPPPVVVPPPLPPAQPKQFIIFFGFNKCNITAEADAVLSEAASAAKS
ncbi:MAG: porin family protein, partial [Micropepsaceae bacterium]